MTQPAVSIVVPVFDEEESVPLLHSEVSAAMQASGRAWEVLYVDDGSRDATLARLRDLAASDPHVTVVRLRRNYGQTAALQAGFDRARGDVIVTLDADLQNDPADIPRMLALVDQGHHVVCGWRQRRHDPWLTRRVPSQVANRIIGWLTGVRLHDNGCTLKAYRAALVKKARLYSDMHRFLAPLLSISGCKYKEVEVNHRARSFGRSKYGLSRIWKVALDLLTLKMLLRFIAHPAAWFALLAVPFAAIGIVATGVAIAWFWSTYPSQPPLVFPGVALLCFFASVNLLFAGMFAELVVDAGDYRESDPIVTTRQTLRVAS